MWELKSEPNAATARAGYAALTAICLLGLGLRFWNIGREALWADEALTLVIAHWPVKTLFLHPVDPTPGLYYALHKLLIGDAADVISVRSISLVAGTLTIPATFALARACRAPALPAALLVALSFPLMDYSQEARPYALLVLLVVTSAAAFVMWTRQHQTTALVIFATTAELSFYTHFVAVFWIIPAVIAARVLANDTPDRSRVVATLAVMNLAALPEMIRLFSYPTNAFSWLAAVGPQRAFNTIAYALLPLAVDEGSVSLESPSVTVAAITAFAVMAWRIVANRTELQLWRSNNNGAAIALAILIVAPAAIWIFSFFKPIFMARTILIAIPGSFVFLALLLRRERQVVSAIVVGFFALALIVTGTTRPKDEWRSVAARLARGAKAGDIVLICASWHAPALRHAISQPRPMYRSSR